MITPSRRSFLTGLGTLIAAPAIVRIDNIMPVRTVILTPDADVSISIDAMVRAMALAQSNKCVDWAMAGEGHVRYDLREGTFRRFDGHRWNDLTLSRGQRQGLETVGFKPVPFVDPRLRLPA